MQYAFEKLEVWILAKNAAKLIYSITANFPSSERYSLQLQLRRSAISICSNISEGSGRNTAKDQAHFSTMAYSSLLETLNQLILAYELSFINQEEYQTTRRELESVSYHLNALRKSQLRRI